MLSLLLLTTGVQVSLHQSTMPSESAAGRCMRVVDGGRCIPARPPIPLFQSPLPIGFVACKRKRCVTETLKLAMPSADVVGPTIGLVSACDNA